MAGSGIEIGGPAPRVLVFLPGFMAPAGLYRSLLEPLADPGRTQVRIPQIYRPGLRALAGRPWVQDEARMAAELIDTAASGARVWLAGHSRGGQAAWLAAELCHVDGLIVVDPVDGAGPRSAARTTARPPRFDVVPLVIGAGIGGPCAPAHLNHERFAAAAPRRIHAVLPKCGHADMLGGGPRELGRRLCGGGPAPDAARRAVTGLMQAHLSGRLDDRIGPAAGPASEPPEEHWPSPVRWA